MKKEIKKTTSLRFYPKEKEALIKRFGSLQRAIDYLIKKWREK